nr:hypothetical protein [Candidatus Dormibacteraeota bacterium]
TEWPDSPSQVREDGAHLVRPLCRGALVCQRVRSIGQFRLGEELVVPKALVLFAAANIETSCAIESTMARINPTPLNIATKPTDPVSQTQAGVGLAGAARRTNSTVSSTI